MQAHVHTTYSPSVNVDLLQIHYFTFHHVPFVLRQNNEPLFHSKHTVCGTK